MIAELLQDTGVWVAISFAIFCLVVFRKGRGPVMAKIDGRIAEIRKEIETAEALRLEAQELLAQYQRKQAEAAEEARTIVQNAQQHAAGIRQQAEAELQAASARHEHQLRERLRHMEETAIQEIRAHAAALAVKATEQIIAEHMDEKTRARLADESIKQVAGQFN